MFDRLFMPALTFTLLAASLAAFAADMARTAAPPVEVVRLERVIVSASREIAPLARADAAAPAAIVR